MQRREWRTVRPLSVRPQWEETSGGPQSGHTSNTLLGQVDIRERRKNLRLHCSGRPAAHIFVLANFNWLRKTVFCYDSAAYIDEQGIRGVATGKIAGLREIRAT